VRKTLLLLSILLPTHICADKDSGTTITIDPTFNNAPIHNTTISPQFITTSTINAIGVQMKDVAFTILQKAQETFTKDNYNSAKNSLKTLLWEYRYNIAAGALLTAYSGTNMILLHDYHYLTDAQRWSCWKCDCTFEALCNIPHYELEQELIRAIGEHHVNKKNPTDLSHPLITFIETIEHEIKTCKRYLSIVTTIKQLHLSKIFPINDAKEAHVHSCLERTLFIRHIFLSWLTERNLTRKIKGNYERFKNKNNRAPLLALCYTTLCR
jgi:hypothetical protein